MKEKSRTSERGQSLVLVAVSLVVLVMFVAVSVDLSSAYYARRTAQNAADGAALGGASRLATGINNKKKLDGQVHEDVNDFAERNGVEDTNDKLADEVNDNVEAWYVDVNGNRVVVDGVEVMVGSGTVPGGAYGVEAITHIRANAFFGGIFGVGGYPVQARAVSHVKQACGSDCLVPMITNDDLLLDEYGEPDYSQCYHIWKERVINKNDISSGLLGWVSWTWQQSVCDGSWPCEDKRPCPYIAQGNGCDAPLLVDNIDWQYCASGFVKVGDWIAAAPGDMAASGVRCNLDYYLQYYDPANPCTDADLATASFTVPVYDYTTENPANPPYTLGGVSSSTCGVMSDPCDIYDITPAYVLHYHVAGLARMQLLQYQLTQGGGEVLYPPDEALDEETRNRISSCVSYYDFDCDPGDTACIDEKKMDGFRITVEFIEYVTDDLSSEDECYDPMGTLWVSPKLTD